MRSKSILMAMVVLMLYFNIFTKPAVAYETPSVLWTKTFGGEGHDTGQYLELTNDRGFIVIWCCRRKLYLLNV